MDIDAVWCFADADTSKVVELGSATNLKRTWTNHGTEINWDDSHALLREATEVKNIWVPYGE